MTASSPSKTSQMRFVTVSLFPPTPIGFHGNEHLIARTVRIWGSSPILLIMFYLLHWKQKSGKQSADEIPCQVSSYFFTGKCKLSSKQAAKLKLYSKSACEESHPVREHWETSSSQHFILQILLKYSLHSNSSKQKLYSCIWKHSLIF